MQLTVSQKKTCQTVNIITRLCVNGGRLVVSRPADILSQDQAVESRTACQQICHFKSKAVVLITPCTYTCHVKTKVSETLTKILKVCS